MTLDEYRAALDSLTPEEFQTFVRDWGGASNSVSQCVLEFASTKDCHQWERVIVFRLTNLGVKGLRTEDEKAMAFAKQTAAAAEASAQAADKSAMSAAGSNRAAWWSQLIALLAIIVMLVIERC